MSKFYNLLGRLLFTVPYAVFGFFHFMNAKQMAGIVPSYLPGPYFWLYLTGVLHIFAAIWIIGNFKKADIVSLGLAVLTLIYVLLIHIPTVAAGGQGAQMAMIGMLKDISMSGGAFYIYSTLKS